MRVPRPSELYRLPQATSDEPPDAPPPRARRRPLLMVGGVVLVVLVAAGLLLGPEVTTNQVAPLDVASEDQAVAALALFAEQDRSAAALRGEPAILSPPGPEQVARDLEARAQATEQALRDARAQQGAEPLAATYWSDPAHDQFVHRLRELGVLATDVALLAAVHDTIYAGAGAIRVGDAPPALVSRFRTGQPKPAAVTAWADVLLAQLDGHEVGPQAAQARERVAEHWTQAADSLRPAAVAALQDYVRALPEAFVQALRGHPVAGPALGTLGA